MTISFHSSHDASRRTQGSPGRPDPRKEQSLGSDRTAGTVYCHRGASAVWPTSSGLPSGSEIEVRITVSGHAEEAAGGGRRAFPEAHRRRQPCPAGPLVRRMNR
jgi:hypothetical protein